MPSDKSVVPLFIYTNEISKYAFPICAWLHCENACYME